MYSTPTSTDSTKATAFAVNAAQNGNGSNGALYIVKASDLTDIPIGQSNCLSDIEMDVVFETKPSEILNRATIYISSDKVRVILSEMGYDVPGNISNGDLSQVLKELPNLSPEEIIEFVKRALEQ